MRFQRSSDQPDDYTHPVAESIDEALARLARQDARLNPPAPPASRARAVRSRLVSRDLVWKVIRWLIILGIAWFFFRAVQGGGR